MDEPAAGLTDKETEQTADLLLELAKEHTLVVIEHDMDFRSKVRQYGYGFERGKRFWQRGHSKRWNAMKK